jgi:mannose-6-phosphate isomerase-like protein (cupin superfamily)
MSKHLVARKVFINPVFKDKVTVLRSSEETGGTYQLAELEVSPGGGNFMHTHTAFEETFIAVKGELGVMLNGKVYFLQPGQSITIPLHEPHHFFNRGKTTITCHVRFSPGHDGFIKGLAIAYGLAADGKTNSKGMPKSLTHLGLLISLTNTRPTGFMGVMFPIFNWLAKRARKKGIERELLEKYYYEQ